MTTDSLELAQRLRLGTEVLRRTIRHSRTLDEIPRRQEAALSLLRRKGPSSIADLARMEQVRPQSMGLTVGELTVAGLVTREPDPSDGRRELVSLTDDGRAVLVKVSEQRDRDLAARFDQLSEADREIVAAFLDLLGRVSTSE